MPETDGSVLYAWQALNVDGRWGTIIAFLPMVGFSANLIHRDEQIVREQFGPLAEAHRLAQGEPVRLARFVLDEVLIARD